MVMFKQFAASILITKRSLSSVTKVHPIQRAALNDNCILVDERDNVIGPISKEKCHLVNNDGSILLHRAFSVFVFNEKDELLLQQRSTEKITYPEYFTNACCSHPLYDIESERNGLIGAKLAAQRRLNFELGIPLDQCTPDSLTYLTRLHYFCPGDGSWGEHEIDYVFILRKSDLTLKANPDEVKTMVYTSPDDLETMKRSGGYNFTPWFQLISTNWLSKWWNNLDNLEQFQDNKIHKF